MSQMFKYPVPAQLVISKMFLKTTGNLTVNTLNIYATNIYATLPAEETDQGITAGITVFVLVVSSLIVFFLQRAYMRLRKICKKRKEKRREEIQNLATNPSELSEVAIEMDSFNCARCTSIGSLDSFHSARSRHS